jgi:hypothetical protein
MEIPYYVRLEVITPEKARELLDNHVKNRRKNAKNVKTYCDVMTRGLWQLPSQIIISDQGRLMDGQHRLEAIILSGVACIMTVLYNVPENLFQYIDIGQKRSLAQNTGIDGDSVKCYTYMMDFAVKKTYRKQPHDITAMNELLAPYISKLTGKNRAFFSSAPVKSAAVVTMYNGGDCTYVADIYNRLVTGNHQQINGMTDWPAVGDPFENYADRFRKGHTSYALRASAYQSAMFLFDHNNATCTKMPHPSESFTAECKEKALAILRVAIPSYLTKAVVDGTIP